MAAPAVGTRPYSYFQTGKEATHGTSVAATRRWVPDDNASWQINDHPHEMGGSRGYATPATTAISQGVTIDIPFTARDGAAFNHLPFLGSQLDAAQTGTGGAADKVWAFAVNQTATEDYESYTIEFGDEIQEEEAEYCFIKDFTMSGDASNRDNMTQLQINWQGRQSTKSTKTGSLVESNVGIPAYLWTPRFATAQSGLSGGSDTLNFMRTWSLNVDPGLTAQFYGDGLPYYGQVTRSRPVTATLTMTVDSHATAVSEFRDKAMTNPKTLDFIQLNATGPALGGTTYLATWQLAVYYDPPTMLAGSIDGVNTYRVVAHLVRDTTWAQSITLGVTCSIAALTA